MRNEQLKTLGMALLTVVLSACQPVAEQAAATTDAAPKTVAPPSGGGSGGSSGSLSAPSFCVAQELRTSYSVPIPVSGSALWVALVHDGYPNRTANPTCLTQYAVTTGGRMYIPCAVDNTEGELYGRVWQVADRPWIIGALTREADLDNVSVSGEVTFSIQAITVGTMFYSQPTLQGHTAVVMSIASTVTFNGQCTDH